MTTIHVNPFHQNATDANSGTVEAPLLTFIQALSNVQDGDTIHVTQHELHGPYIVKTPNVTLNFNGSIFQGGKSITFERITQNGQTYSFELQPGEYVAPTERPTSIPVDVTVPESALNRAGLAVDGVPFKQVYTLDDLTFNTFYQAETHVIFSRATALNDNTRVMISNRPYALDLRAEGITVNDATITGYTGGFGVNAAVSLWNDTCELNRVNVTNCWRGVFVRGQSCNASGLVTSTCGESGVTVSKGGLTINGFTSHACGERCVADNFTSYQGGGIKAWDGRLALNTAFVSASHGFGVWGDYCDLLTLNDCTLVDCKGSGIYVESVRLFNVNGSTVERCNLNHKPYHGGVTIRTANTSDVSGNTMRGNGTANVALYDRDGANVEWGTLTINDNVFDGVPFQNETKTGPTIISKGNKMCFQGSVIPD